MKTACGENTTNNNSSNAEHRANEMWKKTLKQQLFKKKKNTYTLYTMSLEICGPTNRMVTLYFVSPLYLLAIHQFLGIWTWVVATMLTMMLFCRFFTLNRKKERNKIKVYICFQYTQFWFVCCWLAKRDGWPSAHTHTSQQILYNKTRAQKKVCLVFFAFINLSPNQTALGHFFWEKYFVTAFS